MATKRRDDRESGSWLAVFVDGALNFLAITIFIGFIGGMAGRVGDFMWGDRGGSLLGQGTTATLVCIVILLRLRLRERTIQESAHSGLGPSEKRKQ